MNKLKKMALMVVGQNLNTDELEGRCMTHPHPLGGRRGLGGLNADFN